jgi:branched-chain amino acid transport system substrate-binding protein
MKKLAVLSFVAMIVFLSCRRDDPAGSEILIGALLPLTGSAASTGESMKAAMDMAVDEINLAFQEKGRDLTVRVWFEDTKTDTTEARLKLQERTIAVYALSLVRTAAQSSSASNLLPMKRILSC